MSERDDDFKGTQNEYKGNMRAWQNDLHYKKALPLRQSKCSSCDGIHKVTTTAADNGSSLVKASEKRHADSAADYFTS